MLGLLAVAARLLAFLGSRATADVTPSYALGTRTAARIAAALPPLSTRVLVVLRDPLARAYSE